MSVKRDINRLVNPPKKNTALPEQTQVSSIGISSGVATFPDPDDPDQSGGIRSPVKMQITSTETITIEIPEGATSVDIQRVLTFDATDADGRVIKYSINY